MAARKKAAAKKGTATVTKIDSRAVKKIERQRDPLVTEATALVIDDQAGLDRAGELLQVGKELIGQIDEKTEPSRKATHAAWVAVKDMQKGLKSPIESFMTIVRGKVQKFWDEEEARQKIEQDRLDREHRQQLVEEEAQRLADAAQADEFARNMRSDQFSAVGDFNNAQRVLNGEEPILEGDDPTAIPPAAPALADIPLETAIARPGPVAQPAVTKPKGLSMPKRWVGEVTDLNALLAAIVAGDAPESLVTVEQKTLDALARSTKGALNYAGVTTKQVTGTSVR